MAPPNSDTAAAAPPSATFDDTSIECCSVLIPLSQTVACRRSASYLASRTSGAAARSSAWSFSKWATSRSATPRRSGRLHREGGGLLVGQLPNDQDGRVVGER